MNRESLRLKMVECFEEDIRHYSHTVEQLMRKQEDVSRVMESLNGELEDIKNLWHHVTCSSSYLSIRMDTVREARKVVNALLRCDLLTDFNKSFDTYVEKKQRKPEWKWVSRLRGEDGWFFTIYVYPAIPDPLCSPKRATTKTRTERERVWACEVKQ